MISASRELRKPAFPFVPIDRHPADALKAVWRRDHPLHSLAEGFQILHKVLEPEDAETLLPILVKVSRYTLAVDDFIMGRPQAQSLRMLADQRNFVQHTLMSACPVEAEVEVETETRPDNSGSFYRASWCAAMIYSLITVFPIPHRSAPFARLSRQIRGHISTPAIHARWHEAPSLMLWITVMGALGATPRPEKAWYISVLERLANRLRVTSWDDLRAQLRNFLWNHTVSDPDGQHLWKDIRKSSPFVS